MAKAKGKGKPKEKAKPETKPETSLVGYGIRTPESVCPQFDSFGRKDPTRTYRLGLMGGTFDPIHIGHLSCAEQVRAALGLDGVVFIPTGNPVFKRDRQVTPAQTRLLLCHLACSDNPGFGVSSIEVDRGGNTYTVDTLRQLRAFYPDNVELYFITGADAVLSILKWRDSESIADLAHLVAVTRPGSEITQEFKDEMARRTRFDIHYLEIPALSISSSMLRRFVVEGKPIRYLVPMGVYNYITNSGLYLPAE
ncbi:MAG: nicotinate-nucleotide adenylyltransferase [Eggerthellaceae bacterium]|nr:nicotinate-nucleotide adenylyltransferase [Eggerthellaceae bacterium]